MTGIDDLKGTVGVVAGYSALGISVGAAGIGLKSMKNFGKKVKKGRKKRKYKRKNKGILSFY